LSGGHDVDAEHGELLTIFVDFVPCRAVSTGTNVSPDLAGFLYGIVIHGR